MRQWLLMGNTDESLRWHLRVLKLAIGVQMWWPVAGKRPLAALGDAHARAWRSISNLQYHRGRKEEGELAFVEYHLCRRHCGAPSTTLWDWYYQHTYWRWEDGGSEMTETRFHHERPTLSSPHNYWVLLSFINTLMMWWCIKRSYCSTKRKLAEHFLWWPQGRKGHQYFIKDIETGGTTHYSADLSK